MRSRLLLVLAMVVGVGVIVGLATANRRGIPTQTQSRPVPPADKPEVRKPDLPEPRPPEPPTLRVAAAKPDPRELLARVIEALKSGDPEAIRKAADELLARLTPEAVPDGENAATLYKEAFKSLVEPAEEVRIALAAGEQMTPEQRKAVRAWLEANKDVLGLLHQAADRSRCNFGIDYSKGLEAPLPAAPLLAAMKLLRAESLLAEGDLAAESARASYRLSEAFAGEPMLVMQLVRSVSHGIGLSAFERTLAEEPDEEALQEMLGFLTPESCRQGYAAAVMMELSMAARLAVEPGAEQILPPLGDPLRSQILTDWAQALSEFSQLMGRPYHEIRDDLETMERTKHAGTPWYERTVMESLRAFGKAAVEQSRMEATVAAEQLSTALELYRRRNGVYPSSLADVRSILPVLPIDPFSGRPFGYRREGAGFVVYSVGADGNDDGGVWTEKDLMFQIKR